MDQHKILLIEDDTEISKMLADYLRSENYEITCARDGEKACECFDASAFSLVLLDLMIPKISGMDVLRHIRARSVVPVIILSAKDSETDKTLGLELGADDYITKPFSVTEMLARIRSNIRRATLYGQTVKKELTAGQGQAAGSRPVSPHDPMLLSALSDAAGSQILTAKDLVMDLSCHSLTKKGSPVLLTAKEYEILKLLLKNPKKVYTKEQLYSLVWNDVYLGDENAVNVQISRLRNKIEDDPRNPRYVLTVWGIGYKLGEMS